MGELERRVVLSVLDRKWGEHLYEMEYLREGITLRGYGQRGPLVEYQREGYDMFGAMMEGIKEESVGSLFNLPVEVQDSPIIEEAAGGALPGGAVPGTPMAGGPVAGRAGGVRGPPGGGRDAPPGPAPQRGPGGRHHPPRSPRQTRRSRPQCH